MARHTLIEINMNDELPNVIRKCNDNFRRVSSQQSIATDQSVRIEEERSDAQLANAMESVNRTIAAIEDEFDKQLDAVMKALDEATKPAAFAPSVGTYLFSENNPGETWLGTEWERLPENLYLVSSGETVSGQVGSNEVTLTTEQMPQHSHTGPAHSHTMSHTHAHAGSNAAAVSNGAHTHAITRYRSVTSAGGLNPSTSYYKTQVIVHEASTDKTSANNATASAGSHTHSLTGNTAGSSASSTGSSGTDSTGTAGGSAPFDNRPLSQAVPLWKRVA